METISNINWFPGHMTKTKRMMQENQKLIDVVVELADARIPQSSRNPSIDEMFPSKPRLLVLNKCDIADERLTERWESFYPPKGRQRKGGVVNLRKIARRRF